MRKQTKGSKLRQSKAMVKSKSSFNGAKKILQLLERAEISDISTPVNTDAAVELLTMKYEL